MNMVEGSAAEWAWRVKVVGIIVMITLTAWAAVACSMLRDGWMAVKNSKKGHPRRRTVCLHGTGRSHASI
jgi:hypothetical protein